MNSDVQLAVLFDMDGVLIDSYAAHFESWQVVAKQRGGTYTEEEFVAGFGRTSRELIREQWNGAENWSEDEVAQLDNDKEAAFRDILNENFPAMPGGRELIFDLYERGFRIAVASSGPRENVQLVIDRLEIGSCLSAVITGNDVTKGKPDPQVFQLAAQGVDVPNPLCCVIEDAPAGVAAANAAGSSCIGLVRPGKYSVNLDDANLIVSHLNEINPAKIAELIQSRQG
ncbi:Phosphorylated carbohydrates phosphatase [Polystyrenella longa]|uniref:Phosphorylated carbohydrates phosphatase n=1 Tax=Polystyrenella longa TaxID=2528007 RepID=A0A518CR38_9PLAN|nr:HAD family phosphatase [Polystyrenella longa]QDU81673.1 Phosphorylated carbohydrates phosphatase [Polystyrenella longa]